MARLPKCPLCGAKCRRIPYGSVECVKHVRKSILVVRKGKQHMVFGESGCAYEVPDLRAHLAICAKVAGNRKLAKCPLNEDGMKELRAILNSGKGLTNKQALQAYEVLAYWRANYHDAKARLAEKPKGKVVARGWYDPDKEFRCICIGRAHSCRNTGCHRVLIVRAGGPRGLPQKG